MDLDNLKFFCDTFIFHAQKHPFGVMLAKLKLVFKNIWIHFCLWTSSNMNFEGRVGFKTKVSKQEAGMLRFNGMESILFKIWIWIWHYYCMGRWRQIFQVQRDVQLFPFEGINICGCFPLRHKRIHGNRDIFRERWAFEYRAPFPNN